MPIDDSEFRGYLKHYLRYADYLLGNPPPEFHRFYEEGMYVPMLTKLRYVLLLISERCPEKRVIHDEYCSLWAGGREVSLAVLRGNVKVANARAAILEELEKLEEL